jgi:hypothetical protein
VAGSRVATGPKKHWHNILAKAWNLWVDSGFRILRLKTAAKKTYKKDCEHPASFHDVCASELDPTMFLVHSFGSILMVALPAR